MAPGQPAWPVGVAGVFELQPLGDLANPSRLLQRLIGLEVEAMEARQEGVRVEAKQLVPPVGLGGGRQRLDHGQGGRRLR